MTLRLEKPLPKSTCISSPRQINWKLRGLGYSPGEIGGLICCPNLNTKESIWGTDPGVEVEANTAAHG